VRTVETLPRAVREIEHCWIPLSDGIRLAARLWLPAGAETRPVPAILEYLPYGKRDGTRERDEPMHGYFAGHGYAGVRVDLRGTGDSEGLLLDEYLEQELLDGCEVIAWIASQPWCDGTVGMIGKSWGGFNALQIAALRPPALRGVISVCASDDRYADDAHYKGGCLLVENFRWGAALFGLVAHPPDPLIAGDAWRERWLERLEHAVPFAARWLRHPRRDAYWRHGSVAEDPARIACPVWAVGGWADGYSNAVLRLVAALPGACRGLVGPWGHVYAHEGRPGPAIGFLREALRFFGACLRGRTDGASGDPALRAWMQESVAAGETHWERPGRWVAEERWPSPRIRPWRLHLAEGALCERPARGEVALRLAPDATLGRGVGPWCSFGDARALTREQREEDARSLCFDSAPLAERVEILGAPVATIALSVDRPVGQLAVRLCDVDARGSSCLVCYGVRNLTHDASHAAWAPLAPGERRLVRIALDDVAHAFPAGHRVRLAVATAQWPMLWPAPEPVELTLFAGAGFLELPLRPPRDEDASLRELGPPEGAPGPEVAKRRAGAFRRDVATDPETGELVTTMRIDLDDEGRPGTWRFEAIDLEIGHGFEERSRIRPSDPLSAALEISSASSVARGTWSVSIDTRTRVTATREEFRVEAELRAREGDREVFARRWDERVPREGL
jgi:putative CocE/NonD family hydrolase